MEKNTRVSTTEATTEPIKGAFHHDWLRQRLKTAMSIHCDKMNAVPEANAMCQLANQADSSRAGKRPSQATRRAA